MGTMIQGVWHTDDDVSRTDASGDWKRAQSTVRHWVTADGGPGPTGEGGFPAEADRYHLYVAWNCPWAHRALLARAAKHLQSVLPVSFLAPRRTDQGWVFDPANGFIDNLFGSAALHQIYARGTTDYTGRVTLPVLFDTRSGSMISNESADIIRMMNAAWAAFQPPAPDLYPAAHRREIDAWNARIYSNLNNGVYRAGFAASQSAYEATAIAVFETLDAVESQLESTAFLVCDQLTEADLRLFPTLARFDVAYYSAFKCNLRRVTDYPRIWDYARRIYALPGLAETVRFDIYRRGYHSPSPQRNPCGIVPVGPQIDWSLPALVS